MNLRSSPTSQRSETSAGTHSIRTAITLFAFVAFMIPQTGAAQIVAETDDEKAFYTIGTGISQPLAGFKPISNREFELIFQGMRDALNGTAAVDSDPRASEQRIRNLSQARNEASIKTEQAASTAFLAAEALKSGATKTESGLIMTKIKTRTGASPTATDQVKVHYHGTLRDGTVFDSSVDRGTPAVFPLNRVIPCWTEGVAMLKEGGKAQLICPAEIAYGDKRQGRIPPASALIFEVELLEIVK